MQYRTLSKNRKLDKYKNGHYPNSGNDGASVGGPKEIRQVE